MTSVWTDAATADLRFLWEQERLSATLIAVELSEHHVGHFTRSMVISKKRRLGLGGRSPSRSIERQVPERMRVSIPAPQPGQPAINDFTLFDLTERSCRWPMATPPAVNFTRFCGRFTEMLYCDEHTRMAFNKGRNE